MAVYVFITHKKNAGRFMKDGPITTVKMRAGKKKTQNLFLNTCFDLKNIRFRTGSVGNIQKPLGEM